MAKLKSIQREMNGVCRSLTRIDPDQTMPNGTSLSTPLIGLQMFEHIIIGDGDGGGGSDGGDGAGDEQCINNVHSVFRSMIRCFGMLMPFMRVCIY